MPPLVRQGYGPKNRRFEVFVEVSTSQLTFSQLAIANALRYFPTEYHKALASEFANELQQYGHIYMYRLRPTHYAMKAYPIDWYPAKIRQGTVTKYNAGRTTHTLIFWQLLLSC